MRLKTMNASKDFYWSSTCRTPDVAARFESVGLCLPARRVSTRSLVDRCRRAARIDLEKLTGIRERRVCVEGEDSLSLAVDAAWDCLRHSRYQPGDLDVLISCSITRYVDKLSYRFEPALSLSIKEAIGASQCLNFDVTNACAGMLTGILILENMIRAGSARRGMVVSGEYITSLSENAVRSVRSIASPQLASLTVGDSGAAVIVDRAGPEEPGILASEFATFAEHSRLCIGKEFRRGPGATMSTRARKLHRVAIESAAPVVRDALDRCGLRIEDIDYVIPHQTSVRAIRAGIKRIGREVGGLPRHVVVNLEEFGNTASTSHFVALYRYLEEERLAPTDRIMLLSFASGVVIGSLVFEVGQLGEAHARAH